MSTTEILATAATVLCVLLAVKRSIWQYPVGLVSTAAFFAVFWQARLYSSAALQVFFFVVQLYGWWYWLWGAAGGKPRITSSQATATAGLCLAGVLFAIVLSTLLRRFTDAQMAFLDSTIFGLSIAAQFLLDRKKIENWVIWGVVDLVSVWVYASQGLWLTTALYVALTLNVVWGYWEWLKEMNGYTGVSEETAW